MPGRPYQFLLPEPIDRRVEQLTTKVRREGHHVSRSEVVGALIWSATKSGDDLSTLVKAYLKAVQNYPEVETERRPPGPRPLVDSTT
jgi:hypothetical protein